MDVNITAVLARGYKTPSVSLKTWSSLHTIANLKKYEKQNKQTSKKKPPCCLLYPLFVFTVNSLEKSGGRFY